MAHNGATVVVEPQARFDEEANIHWARRLTEAGVHVIFSAPGRKFTPSCLILRKEAKTWCVMPTSEPGTSTRKRRGFTPTTRLLTADARITNEVRRVFNFIENPYLPGEL